jgi:hypothetical protein
MQIVTCVVEYYLCGAYGFEALGWMIRTRKVDD